MCDIGPQAVLEVTDVMEICPSGLLIRWTPPHPTLLGGPEDQVEYVLTFMAEGTPVANVTFPFDPMLTVSLPLLLAVCGSL